MRRLALVLAAFVVGVTASAVALSPGESLVRSRVDGTETETFAAVGGTECWRNEQWVIRPQSVALVDCTPPPPTTEVATTTTEAATTTTEAATTTTTVPSLPQGFVETFDGDTGLDRFRTGVQHRDDTIVSMQTWPGDHDAACGSPDTQRTIHRDAAAESFYLCRDHLMTSVGDTSGYSIAWFSPKQTFTTAQANTVSWDVNVTDLGTRQWWEVAIVAADGPDAACASTVTACDSTSWDVGPYGPEDVSLGNGPLGGAKPSHTIDGKTSALTGVAQGVCNGSLSLDPEGCASKAIRRTWSMTDNRNGTITFRFHIGTDVREWTRNGAFPDGEWKVVFKDHNYTPNKDGKPIGYTWHWDNIAVTNS